MNVKHGFPVFNTLIEANHLCRVDEIENLELPDEDKKMI